MAKSSRTRTIGQAAKQYSKLLQETPTAADVARQRDSIKILPLGLPAVDWGVLGIGGLPFGFGIELIGVEGSGKTLLAIRAVAQLHKYYPKEMAYWADCEGSHVPQWMSKNGVDLTRIKIAHSLGAAEEYEKRIVAAIASGYKLIVLDSAPSMLPRAIQELEDSNLKMNEKNEQSQYMTTFLSKIEAGWPSAGLPSFASTGAIFLIINHTKRFQADDYAADSKGAGKIKHFCRMRINIEKLKMLRDDRGSVMFKPPAHEGLVRCQCLKNQLALPMCESTYHVDLRNGNMWDDIECVKELGLRNGTLVRGGAWYMHGKMKWNGIERLEESVRAMPELADRICRGPNAVEE